MLLVRARDDREGRRWRAAEVRTRDELRMLGVVVEEVQGDDLERALVERGADAAVRVRREGDSGRAEVWWIDRRQGEPRSLELDGLPIDGAGAAPLAALRTAEFVHAAISPPPPEPGARQETTPPQVTVSRPEPSTPLQRPLALQRATPRQDTPPPLIADAPIVVPVPPRIVAPPAPEIRLDELVEPVERDVAPARAPSARPIAQRGAFGVYADVGGGPGSGALVGGAIAVQRRLRGRLWLRGELHGATAASWRTATGGAVRTGHAAAHLMLLWIAREQAVLSPRIGVGGGPGLAWAIGRATDPRRSGDDLAAVASLRGLVGAAIRVRPHLRLVVGADLELLLPPVVVEVAGAEVARLGTPLVRGTIGLEWGWPRRSERRPIGGRETAKIAEPPVTARATSSP